MPFRQRMARHFGDSLSPEKAYLSYYDVLLTVEDIKSLKNDWLTDNNIAFWEEYLEHETLPRFPQARIILLRPSMTFLLMKEPDMRHVQAALPDFSKVTHVFLPINDNRNVAQAEGGSHWSLLLVSVLDGIAFHYDSLGGANYAEAALATRKLGTIVGRQIRFINLEDSPQQENGSDCGVFVCLLMRHLLVKRLLVANAREKVSMSMAGKMVDSNGGRKEMLKIIENLRKEGERRRSDARRTARFGSWEEFEKRLAGQHGGDKTKESPVLPEDAKVDKTKESPVLPEDAKVDKPKAVEPRVAKRKAVDAKLDDPETGSSKKKSPKTKDLETKDVKTKDLKAKDVKTKDSKTSNPKTTASKTSTPKTGASKTGAPKAAKQTERPTAKAKSAGKGQLASPSSSNRSTTSSQSPKSSSSGVSKSPRTPTKRSPQSSQSSQSTPTPVRMRRIVQPPLDPKKPNLLEMKFGPMKVLKRANSDSSSSSSSSSKPPAVTSNPSKATPIKDRGLKAALR
ncbi:uncharacterized protein T069G_10491 [Trichoderma breve]|uniref:Ubiquitin-like protease family profile domain-containing protein n=1 Tax=Trichoderma breve TaxID=2034170 RepID=A0A9W9B329_9HYPO|nr:uncharacterized protein T069G_10491 [Trichoderma breve]KAJ4854933.1 hypothetical protein T069G_10491 [Trichoderma breve]